MPTLPSEVPSEQPSSPSSERLLAESHRARRVAESFGTDPERYDRTRPRYADALVERVVAASPGVDVLDVGCGTGIVARQFRAAGCRVLGVEPDARMADLARRHGVDVEVSTFEGWDPRGRAFDAVVSGQTWHWVDPVAGAAKAAEALRPGGRLALFWNAFELPPETARAFDAVLRRVLPDAPMNRWAQVTIDGYSAMLTRAEEGLRQAGGFGAPDRYRFDWERRYSREEWLDQVPTFGGHDQVPPGTMQELLHGLGAAVDALGGSFTMRYATIATVAPRSAVRPA